MLIIRQECSSVGHFQEFEIPSKTQMEKTYKVLIHPDRKRPEDSMCDCEGYFYRHYCSHIDLAKDFRCDWVEGEKPIQTPNKQVDRECPRCGLKTNLVVIDG